jgi:hypothetical protein
MFLGNVGGVLDVRVGRTNLFLRYSSKANEARHFVHQAKYMKDLMKKFNMSELKPVSTLMSMATTLDPDENGEAVDEREYRSMIGSLLYLMTTRSDIQFAVCLCVRF